MKEILRSLKWRKLIMVSILLGAIFSIFNISGSFTQTAFSQIGIDNGPGGADDPEGSRCCVTSELQSGCVPNGCQGSFLIKNVLLHQDQVEMKYVEKYPARPVFNI